ncbi:MAG: hypothetical protein J6Z27_03025, partial [Bacteroidales bacterium]|nr:hypothetical protein [Bacteroidales bacterium]
NSQKVFSINNIDTAALLDAIVTLSAKSSLRFGDLVAVPLSEGYPVRIGDRISFCGRELAIF